MRLVGIYNKFENPQHEFDPSAGQMTMDALGRIGKMSVAGMAIEIALEACH